MHGLCQLFPEAASKAMQTALGENAQFGGGTGGQVSGRLPSPRYDNLPEDNSAAVPHLRLPSPPQPYCTSARPSPRLSLATCLDLLKRCSSLYRELTSCSHIFQPISILLSKHRPVKTCPTALQEDHGEVLGAISGSQTSRPPLVFEKKKPIPLKLFTPKIVEAGLLEEAREHEEGEVKPQV
uniref:Uncharacterized protein n=1 Tax=Hucho hucho TaxID=62062 RepID=A0A4W5NJX8_9TELE